MTYEELLADPATQKLLETFAAKYPGKRLRPIDTAAGVIICVNPSRPQYNLFRSALWSDDKLENAKAHENLLRACVVHPETAVFSQWLEEYPGIDSDKDVVLQLRMLAGAAKDAAKKA